MASCRPHFRALHLPSAQSTSMNFRVVAFSAIVPTVRHLDRTYGRQQNSETNSPTNHFSAAADALGMCVTFLSTPVFDSNCVPDVGHRMWRRCAARDVTSINNLRASSGAEMLIDNDTTPSAAAAATHSLLLLLLRLMLSHRPQPFVLTASCRRSQWKLQYSVPRCLPTRCK